MSSEDGLGPSEEVEKGGGDVLERSSWAGVPLGEEHRGEDEKEEDASPAPLDGTTTQRPAAPPRRLSTRLSFHEHDIEIPGVGGQEAKAHAIAEGAKPRSSMFGSMVSSVLGSSQAPPLDRSLSNTIRVSQSAKVDMSVFEQKKAGNAWASTGVTVGTDNLSYFVRQKKRMFSRGPEQRKTLLKHVTINVHPGEVAFVMGPSGAGKSTLLDVLAGRVKQGIMSGQVVFNGQARGQSFWDNSAYVRQDDIHIPTLTVFETLTFAARLRLGSDYEEEERQVRVSTIAELLGLTACQFSYVGDSSLRGISGGQLKRLSIAVEIVNMPSLIFLDEPTSGLDSVMSYEVMSFTSRLAEQNRTIIATIHQPSTETFMLSNKVIIVSSGRVMYCGPTAEVIAYFTSPRLGYRYDGRSNPADFAIAVVSGAEKSDCPDLRTTADAKVLADRYASSQYFQQPMRNKPTAGDNHKHSKEEIMPTTFKTSTLVQTIVLLQRFWITLIRQREFLQAHVAKNIVVAATCGTIFWMQGKESEALPTFSNSSFNVSSLWYFAMLYTILSNLQIIPQLFFFRVIYTRERSAQVYSTFAYWASMAIVNLPLLFVSHIIFVSIAYWMIGVSPNLWDHLYSIGITFMNNLVAFYSAQLLAACCATAEIALALFPVTFLFLGSFAGFSIPLRELPEAWEWATYISYPRWTYEGLIINEFHHRPDNRAVLSFYAFENFNKMLCFPILLCFIAVMNLGVYVALLPAKSKLEIEELTEAMQSPKPEEAAAVVILDPVLTPSSSVMQIEDFRLRSSNRIPVTAGVSLIFRNLEYAIGPKGSATKILKGVTGKVAPGEMCALMGGSGAGKSTLLDLLAYRKTSGFITGEYYINGKPDKPSARWCSYVTQDNVHIGCFTVWETLQFAVMLRLDETLTMRQRNQRAQDVMEMLGLEGVSDVIVGDALNKGISGGQARRLSIGVEIVQLPDVIFLDEPTTGLDSQISYEVMASVRNIADHNRTVVCTIHSPSESVYNLFDSLILLAMGRQTYFGGVTKAVQYFTSPPISWVMPVSKNPADFVMEASQGLISSTSEGMPHTVRDLNNYFLASENYQSVDTLIEATVAKAKHDSNNGRRVRTESVVADVFLSPADHPRSLASQVRILSWRQLIKLSKMTKPLVAASLRNVVIAVFHGSLYYRMRSDAIQSRLSLLFFAIMLVMMSNQQFIPNVFEDRLLFYRERGAGVYGSLPYWIVSSLPYIPQQLGASVVYSAIVYHLARLHSGSEYFWYFTLIVAMSSLCGLFFCLLLSFSTPSPQIAVSIFPAALFLIIAFAGFVVRLPSLPKWLGVWAPEISFARWGFQGLVINEFKGNPDVDYGVIVPSYVVDKYQLFIENFGFDGFDKWATVPILCISIGVLWLMCYLPVRFMSFEKR